MDTIDTVRFPCAPWQISGDNGSERMSAVPGTWTCAPESLCAQGIKGILSCPNRTCKQAALIPYNLGQVVHGVLHLQHLQCGKCGLRIHARLLEWDRRKLYCVVYEVHVKSEVDGKVTILPRREYLHAEGRPEAVMSFMSGTGYHLDHEAKAVWKMVDCGLAIGYFGQESDKDQKTLSVD